MNDSEKLKILLKDTTDAEKYIRNKASIVLSAQEVYGDEYFVPSIEDIVDLLIGKIKRTMK